MAKYAVFAADQMYQGYYGMNWTGVIEAKSTFEVECIAYDHAISVIRSYPEIYESLIEESPFEEVDEYEDMVHYYEDDVLIEYTLLDENKIQGFTLDELNWKAKEMDYYSFVAEYGVNNN